MPPKVDLGIACRETQSHHWWSPLLAETIALTKSGEACIERILPVGSAMADFNQCLIVKKFLEGGSEWLWMIEDDTTPPKGALRTLLSHHKPFVSGLYYLGYSPYSPVAFWRNTPEDFKKNASHYPGMYRPIRGFERGEIFTVDSVGMGCALINRSVFERIQATHTLKMRVRDAAVIPVPNDGIYKSLSGRDDGVHGNCLSIEVTDPPAGDTRPWPFYAFELGRTQDHWFNELAACAGFKPLLDTSLECKHWKLKAITGAAFRTVSDRLLAGDQEAAREGS